MKAAEIDAFLKSTGGETEAYVVRDLRRKLQQDVSSAVFRVANLVPGDPAAHFAIGTGALPGPISFLIGSLSAATNLPPSEIAPVILTAVQQVVEEVAKSPEVNEIFAARGRRR